MNTSNPTPLRIGMRGTLAGREYRIAGRMVLGMEEEGEIYTWNEFYLKDPVGNEATLVWEDAEGGPTWKLFQYFEPGTPLTYEQVSKVDVGDTVNIDGMAAKVELIDESKVYFIEGEAPEGVERGDMARYFNSWLGDNMLVVSWTGREVEHFLGDDLSPSQVAKAFNVTLPIRQESSLRFDEGAQRSLASPLIKTLVMAGVGLLFLFNFIGVRSCGSSSRSEFRPLAAPAYCYELNAPGRIRGSSYQVMTRALVECARPNGTHFSRLYLLQGTQGEQRRLLQGTERSRDEWLLLMEARACPELSSAKMAELKPGQTFAFDGQTLRVTQLMRTRTRSLEGQALDDIQMDHATYGLMAKSAQGTWFFQWDDRIHVARECFTLSERPW